MEKFFAYAKINLSLHILEKRSDSFHNLDSILSTINLYDTISLQFLKDNKLKIFMNGKLCDEKNSVTKVCKEVQKYHDFGAKIYIKKVIPFCSGLGGSSADASAVLNFLAKTFAIDDATKREIAQKVGSDVWFLCLGGTARICGKGEEITKLPFLPLNVLVLKGSKGISTKNAFAQFSLQNDYADKDQKIAKNDLFQKAIIQNEDISQYICNDFLPTAKKMCKSVEKNLALLQSVGATAVGLSGSGSAVFGIFKDKESCLEGAKNLKRKTKFVFATNTIENF